MPARLRNPWGRPRFLVLGTWVYVAWALLPVVIAILFSFNAGRSRSVWQGFSIRWWWGDPTLSIFHDPDYTNALWHSLELAALIAGFERPTAGEILLDGNDVASVPPHERNVHTVFQNYALFPHLDVWANIAFGLRRHKVAKEEVRRRVEEAIRLVELDGLAARRPRQLSGGQQQRVALARALVLRPAVLLLDEPLGALDAKIRKQLRLELKSLQEEVGITFVFVTHDQEEALSMSDRLAVMNAGRIEQIGTPAEVYENPGRCSSPTSSVCRT